ncbi:murein DD-endopeptidase MepM/ murein hydrolase activator NlpD [Natranaerovirga hydrolytica]|uniref:Murein DD-endopeptidase MepM/ murein hydrolase activator NlpD n=1 Tax=Natranaerovirga hydrolytica TaxID=680378 RepID=A0A4R1MK33_9FIRM|nr:M23 family metallopeptidase [Natranaerovirga hydrolytica]TCK93168.1 murein DD-endopeptidase MepM/ murein hydrolase activator NlpD [Natranaerovirga hydrolytica]
MNGLPKFSETMVIKRMQIIMIAFCTMFIVFAVNQLGSQASSEREPVLADAYKVVFEGNEIGIVEDKEIVDALFNKVTYKVQREINKSILIDKELEIYVENTAADSFTTVRELEDNLYNTIVSNLHNYKQKAYILKINDLEIALENEEDILKVLEEAQRKYDVNGDFGIELVADAGTYGEEEKFVPKVLKLEKEARDVNLLTSSNEENLDVDSDTDAEESIEKDETTEIVEIEYVEQVEVFSGYITSDQISTTEEAIELITKEKEEEKVYEVESGDSLSVIAHKNEMRLTDLLKLNPDLHENSVLQIGQELVVTVPEPELSIVTKERIFYTADIKRSTEYVDNPNQYEGHTSTVSSGSDGVMEVTAIISKVNGIEEGKEIVDELIIQEAEPRIVERGTKPLPYGSTGQFIRPISGGRLTSGFGYRSSGFHSGIDLATNIGTPVMASDGGKVTYAGWQGAYGYVIYVDHGNGVQTRYAHLNRILVSKGQVVSQYEKIAETGNTGRSTGPHIHFEVRVNGSAQNPLNYIR